MTSDDDKNTRTVFPGLPDLNLPTRVLLSGYLFVTGIGMMMAFGQILATHGMADGKFGLSINDIVYSYYGNRGNSKLESKLNGTMKDKASTQVRAEIIKWVRDGAPRQAWDKDIKNHFHANCTRCHGSIPNLTDLSTYENVKPVAAFDEGMSLVSLTRVSHIHLFGIVFIFFFSGLIFNLTVNIKQWLKVLVIAMPFAFIIIDIFSWWLTKLSPGFAWFTMIGGFGYALSSLFMWTACLYQMWIMPRTRSGAKNG